ncbi:FumA C-terminus/TtdB family hydratase beta subunit [bacterium]
MIKQIQLPFSDKIIKTLKAGDELSLNGIVYTARDAAHKKIFDSKKIPFDINKQTLYYVGPTPAPSGRIIGSCGPTTSGRMDSFTPYLLSKGLCAMIGKGKRSPDVVAAIKKYKAVYLVAPGGCGALLSECVKKIEPVAYPELLSEAIYKLTIENFPVIVGIDSKGKSVI